MKRKYSFTAPHFWVKYTVLSLLTTILSHFNPVINQRHIWHFYRMDAPEMQEYVELTLANPIYICKGKLLLNSVKVFEP